MASSSKSRSNAPVLPLSLSFSRSIPPSGRFSTPSSQPTSSDPFFSSSLPSTFTSSSSSMSMPSSIFDRPLSPTRVNLSSSSVPSFRISLNNRSLSPNTHASVSVRDQCVSKPASFAKSFTKKTCMCSPTTHPGSFKCAYHRNGKNSNSSSHQGSSSCSPSRLNLRRSAMTNSLVRIGTVEGDWVRRALTALIRPSSHQQRRRANFQPRPSRLSVMYKAGEDRA